MDKISFILRCTNLAVCSLLLHTFLIDAFKEHSCLAESLLHPQMEFFGAVLTHIHKKDQGYGSSKAHLMRKHLETVGYNSVQLNSFAYMQSAKDQVVLGNKDPTLTLEALTAEIRQLRKMGFTAMLKPHIWVGGHSLDPANWLSAIDFKNQKERQALV